MLVIPISRWLAPSRLRLPVHVVLLTAQGVCTSCILLMSFELFVACCTIMAQFDFVPMQPAVAFLIQICLPFSPTSPLEAVVPAAWPETHAGDDGKEHTVGAFLLLEALGEAGDDFVLLLVHSD